MFVAKDIEKRYSAVTPVWSINVPTAYDGVEQRERTVVFLSIMPNSSIVMAANLILSKESSESEIKRYFNAVLELSKSDNEFPINIDDVWMLVYSRRDYATDALKKDFIENVDYRCTSVKTEVGSTRIEYEISVSCMEFFIARKVRPVFEVYRQVFHKVAKHELSRKELALMVIQAEEEKERLALEVQQQQATIELQDKELKQAAPKVEYCDKVLSSQGYLTVNMIAACLGISDIKLNKLLCQWGIQYKESGVYYLYSKYRDKGYTVHKPRAYTDSLGNIKTRQHMYWTEVGKKFILELYSFKVAA